MTIETAETTQTAPTRRELNLVPNTIPVCPDCGGRLEYRETTICSRSVQGVDSNGVLWLEPTYEAWDCDGTDEHIICQECDAEFEVPIDADYDYFDPEDEAEE